ncbi:MAG: ATP-binding protein [Planctomycetota bacterium]
MSQLAVKVLHVEDTVATAKIVALALSKAGIPSHHVTSAAEALQQLSGGSFDLVISDVMMPGMDGLDLIKTVRKLPDWNQSHVHLLMLTAKDGKESKLALFEAGADDFLAKPFDLDELVMRVRVGLRLRTLARELKAAQDENERILGIVAHDLRNPIGVIQGVGELISEGHIREINEDNLQLLGLIRRQTTTMLALISDLVDVTRLEAGRAKPRLELADVSVILGHAWETYKRQGQVKGLVMSADCGQDLPKIHVDPKLISTVASNLLSNAVKFSKPGDTVTLAVRPKDSGVEFEVADTGQGISEMDLAKVFDKMPRLSPRATGGDPSTGLGLALSRRIVHLHGGTITVRSQLGKGSTFVVTIPSNA